MPFISPSTLDAEHINRVVSIQVFNINEGQVDSSSLRKHVGILEGYSITPGRMDIKLSGLPLICTSTKAHYVELYRLA